jgi:hypothetical protein
MTERDIVDAIDELVDTQMAGGEPETGYDFDDPTFPDCPHSWCNESWHGLAITQRMRDMRWRGEIDVDYRYNEDDSTVLCPGSDFTGEFTPPEPEQPVYPQWVMSRYGWEIPDDPLDGSSWVVPELQFPRALLGYPNPFLPDISADLEEILRPLFEPIPEPVVPLPVHLRQGTVVINSGSGWEPLGFVEPGTVQFRPTGSFAITEEQWQAAISTDVQREFTVEFQVDPAVTASAATGPWYAELINQLHRRTSRAPESFPANTSGEQAA